MWRRTHRNVRIVVDLQVQHADDALEPARHEQIDVLTRGRELEREDDLVGRDPLIVDSRVAEVVYVLAVALAARVEPLVEVALRSGRDALGRQDLLHVCRSRSYNPTADMGRAVDSGNTPWLTFKVRNGCKLL